MVAHCQISRGRQFRQNPAPCVYRLMQIGITAGTPFRMPEGENIGMYEIAQVYQLFIAFINDHEMMTGSMARRGLESYAIVKVLVGMILPQFCAACRQYFFCRRGHIG